MARTRIIILEAVVLALLWLAFSGKLDVQHLTFGAISVVLILWSSRTLVVSLSTPDENQALTRIQLFQALLYPFWLAWQILAANLLVARMILSPSMPINPAVLRFRAPVRGKLGKVILGNSITLTPGTFTLDIQDDVFLVHAISPGTAGGVINGSMQRRVAALFGDKLLEDPNVHASKSVGKPKWKAAPWPT